MKISQLIIVFLVCVLQSGLMMGQSFDYSKREIIVSANDSLIKVNISNKTDKLKVSPNFRYYWYYAGVVNNNIGGYSGKLLHGKYEVFNNQQKLLVQGFFEFGLMKGTWNRWYQNGNIQFSGYYKNGMLQGKAQMYSAEGNVVSVMKYKNGQLDGKSYFYQYDTVFSKVYNNGKERIKRKKLPKKTTIKKEELPSKEDVKQNVIPVSPSEKLNSDKVPKSKWWKFTFLKKKRSENPKAEAKSSSVNKNQFTKPVPKQKQLKPEVKTNSKWYKFQFLTKKKVKNKKKTSTGLPSAKKN